MLTRTDITFVPPLIHSIPFQYETSDTYFKRLEITLIWLLATLANNWKDEDYYHCGIYNNIGVLFSQIAVIRDWDKISCYRAPMERHLEVATTLRLPYFDSQMANDDFTKILQAAKVNQYDVDDISLAYSCIDNAAAHHTNLILLCEKGKPVDPISKYAEQKVKDNHLKCIYIHPKLFYITDEQNIVGWEESEKPDSQYFFQSLHKQLLKIK